MLWLCFNYLILSISFLWRTKCCFTGARMCRSPNYMSWKQIVILAVFHLVFSQFSTWCAYCVLQYLVEINMGVTERPTFLVRKQEKCLKACVNWWPTWTTSDVTKSSFSSSLVCAFHLFFTLFFNLSICLFR